VVAVRPVEAALGEVSTRAGSGERFEQFERRADGR
jgi:hypothetical protein